MSSHTIPNDVEPTHPIRIVSLSNTIKLTTINYISWKLQIQATLDGYGLFKFLDGSHPPPATTIVKESSTFDNNTTETTSTPNPAYQTWIRQDRLLFGALIGTLEQQLVPLVSLTTTTRDLWETLANTYASASRGHVKQLTQKLKNITKGPQSILVCSKQ